MRAESRFVRLRSVRRTILVLLLFAVLAGAAIAEDSIPITPAERMEFRCSPTWDETVEYLKLLDDASPLILLKRTGGTTRGEDLQLVLIGPAADRHYTHRQPSENDSIPVVLVIAGIHSGEICGKDGLLIFLRDVALGKYDDLVDKVKLHIVPVFNIDGHENRGEFNRFTQVGP